MVDSDELAAWAEVLGVPAKAPEETDDQLKERIIDALHIRHESAQITLQNRIRLQHAASALREVLPGYGIDKNELQSITKPLAEKIQQLLENEC